MSIMNNPNDIKNDNRGISLIEILIVISIMVILSGVFMLTTTVATDKQVNSCANKIVSSIEQTRSITLGKQSGYIVISQGVGETVKCQMYINGAYPYGTAYSDQVTIGHQGLTVTVNKHSGSAPLAGTSAVVSFSRSNGSVTDSDNVESIVVSNGRRSITITIDKFTGKVSKGPVVIL